MLVQEMHIDFDIKFQKIDSNNIDTFLPQEKDWLLNIAQLRFIRKHGKRNLNKLKEGGEDSFTRYEDFNELIKRVDLATTVQDGYVDSVLPYDFFDYRNGSTKSFYDCNGITSSVTSNSNKIFIVDFADSVSVGNKFVNFRLDYIVDYTGTPVLTPLYSINDYDLNYGNPFTSNEEKFLIVNHVLEVVNNSGLIEVRWENYGDTYKPNSFIFITNDLTIDAIRISYDAVSNDKLTTVNNYDSYSDNNNVIVKNNVALRLVETEDLFDALNHPYAKTIYNSPITTLRDGKIQVYNSEKFIINNIQIDYIRKPRMISLSLNQSCEISESRHDVIVDFAVQLASAYVGSNTHQFLLNENLINE
jgi:hypothetical protein